MHARGATLACQANSTVQRRADLPFSGAPALCGHRGSGRGARENTLGSFRDAVAAGLDWVEVDVRLTTDGALVAHHDPVLADGRPVAALSAVEADAAGLMRLADLFEALPAHVGVNVEVKSALQDALRPPDRTTAAVAADATEAERWRRRVLLTSFDPAALLTAGERAAAVPAGLLTWTRFPLEAGVAAARHLGVAVIVAHYESFRLRDGDGDEPAIGVAHAAGLQIAAWCPPAPEAERLAAAGVDCLVLDEPAWRQRLVARIR
jgi:glycerophosphoryl diester phosphodiesterase